MLLSLLTSCKCHCISIYLLHITDCLIGLHFPQFLCLSYSLIPPAIVGKWLIVEIDFTYLFIYLLYIGNLCAFGLIIAVFVGACSPESKPTAEIVSHDGMELQFLGVGDSAFSPCRSVTQGKCIPPPSFPPPFLSLSLSLAAPALLCIYPSFHLFTHLPVFFKSFLTPPLFFFLSVLFSITQSKASLSGL